MTEFALVTPILFFLLFAVLEGSLMLFSVGSARFAAGEAARQLAESGNAANADTLSLGVIRGTALGTTTLASVVRIDFYHLVEQSNGTLLPDTSTQSDNSPTSIPAGKINAYRLDGTALAVGYPPNTRNVVNGQSDFVGITIFYQYNWKSGLVLGQPPLALSQTFYIRLEPQTY